MYKFKTALPLEQIEENFEDFNLFDNLKEGLTEAIEYEKENLEAKKSNSAKHTRAAAFGKQVTVSNFSDTQNILKKKY